MSILTDKALKSKKESQANKNFDTKSFFKNIKINGQIRIFLNDNAKSEYEKNQSIIKKSNIKVVENENDTYDLIMNDYKLYHRLLVVANILKAKGITNTLTVNNGFIIGANDKVQEILSRLADKLNDPNISDASLETETKEAIILTTDIDERAALPVDLNNNGMKDRLEQRIGGNSLDAAINKGKEKQLEEIKKLRSTEEGIRRQELIAKKYAEDREKEEAQHKRKGFTSLFTG